ncbi:hypothetical protein LPJ57_004533 [Coemansia sp. RSA 486]|nr:hypothetical protein LPJ57_004533 [Coemansia sp. RSA 486]KAJ2226657.1 hypothetical protein IWW45_007365 [Coemansia sp. RSA 485]
MTFRNDPQTIPKDAKIELCTFSDDPLLLRMDMATYGYYSALTDSRDRRLMEIASRSANVNVQTRPAGRKELKQFGDKKNAEAVRNVRLKYRTKQDQIAQLGTFDMQWGLRWLLSFVVLVEEPVLGVSGAERMVSVVEGWIRALASADIYEVSNQQPQLMRILDVARKELPLTLAVSERLPGKLNLACSLLFAGQLRNAFVDAYKPRWALTDQVAGDQKPKDEDAEVERERARDVVDGVVPVDAECTRSRPVDLRIASIDLAAEDCSERLSRVCVRIYDRSLLADRNDEEPVDLLFEADVASCLCVGFVIEATLHTLSNGMHYMDAVTMVWPSYAPLDYVDGH